MIFIVNFIEHHYQFYWNVEKYGSQYAETYKNCQIEMVSFLKKFLLENDISTALEEGGACMDIIEALRKHGNDKTFLQEAINDTTGREIFHDFVDITKDEVEELIKTGAITSCAELRNKKENLRDTYIAKAAMKICLVSERRNSLLLCADKHFNGIKEFFEQSGIQVIPDSINKFEWFRSGDQINLAHENLNKQ